MVFEGASEEDIAPFRAAYDENIYFGVVLKSNAMETGGKVLQLFLKSDSER
ncbi:hypothetical protein IH992_06125 [Candidatus Poribacteria bacterium]|nr:hypothetical protein [Candidatus Poribacteria bacterium]